MFDGGHSPLLLDLRPRGVLALSWIRPRKRLPSWLYASSGELRETDKWKQLQDQWTVAPTMARLAQFSQTLSLSELSRSLEQALQELVSCAGEWETRPPVRRPAYESATVRHLRISLELLDKCSTFLQTDSGIGSFSHPLEVTLAELRKRRFAVPHASRAKLISWVEVQITRLIPEKRAAMKEMREERKARFKAGIPRLYENATDVFIAGWKATPQHGALFQSS